MINFFCITKESMIRDICDFDDIEYKETESAVLYELFLYVQNGNQATLDILDQVDWKFIKDNNKKLIITHRIIYHLEFFKEALLEYLNRYDCKDNVFWYSFNPYEANDKDINVTFFDPINHGDQFFTFHFDLIFQLVALRTLLFEKKRFFQHELFYSIYFSERFLRVYLS